ncbi:TrkH family potassium uptake protein [Falsihalocynthiibacter sp. SS001]|uniref:TrkH family potassium uptake protein n=1 Tax=Falsihalocynthiibacter sp. SS001 TaxID=3349698 RepID=UPI0036D2C655
MMELRPVANITGILVSIMGCLMLVCGAVDAYFGGQPGSVFMLNGLITILIGTLTSLATSNHQIDSLGRRQSFLLTSLVWAVLPIFGALPFIFGNPNASIVDAYFEAMSGMTTTGSTVFRGLDDMPEGVLLWRGILQWLGGLGIVVVAMIFLPTMRVGGMQFFLTEGFDTQGKILPRAFDIAKSLFVVYVVLTILCFIAYAFYGMRLFDALVHSLTTISTGGFSTSDQSFSKFSGRLEYVAAFFMILASLPLIRYFQLVRGQVRPLTNDVQVQAYLRWIVISCALIAGYHLTQSNDTLEQTIRETVFNVTSLFSGTGYTSVNMSTWGAFPLTVLVLVGLIGGCTGSTACSIKVFRWLILVECIKDQLRHLRYPHSASRPRLGNRPLSQDVIDSVSAFFAMFILTLGFIAVGLSFTGLSLDTAITAAWTSVANIGPAYGQAVSGTGSMEAFPEAAKWIMIFGMLAGRLEILSFYLLLTRRFWLA